MQIHDLKSKTKRTRSRQVGRGGKRGKTSGRGTKGQKARAGRKLRPEIRDQIKKIPKLRGRGKNSNKRIAPKPTVINLALIESAFENGQTVSPTVLVERQLVRRVAGRVPIVKILGQGSLTKSVAVDNCLVSATALVKLKEVGATVA